MTEKLNLDDMVLELKTDELPEEEQFYELYYSTGWEYEFKPEELLEAIKNSWYTMAAYHGERLVGFGRILSDGIYQAFICDLIVLPDYQGKGIGGSILRRLVKKCRDHDIRMIMLFCASGQAGFYEKFGFTKRPREAPGMILKRESEI